MTFLGVMTPCHDISSVCVVSRSPITLPLIFPLLRMCLPLSRRDPTPPIATGPHLGVRCRRLLHESPSRHSDPGAAVRVTRDTIEWLRAAAAPDLACLPAQSRRRSGRRGADARPRVPGNTTTTGRRRRSMGGVAVRVAKHIRGAKRVAGRSYLQHGPRTMTNYEDGGVKRIKTVTKDVGGGGGGGGGGCGDGKRRRFPQSLLNVWPRDGGG